MFSLLIGVFIFAYSSIYSALLRFLGCLLFESYPHFQSEILVYYMSMKNCDKRTLDAILAHKDHFDQKLIEIVQNLEKQNQALSAEIAKKDMRIQTLNYSVVAANTKISDMKCVNKSLQMEKKEADDLAKEFEEMLRKMQKELDEIKKENDANYEEIQKMRKEAEKNRKEIERQKKIINKLQGSNSTNSNLPSSADILSHTVPKERRSINSRKKSTRSRGGQKGHQAHLSGFSVADQINTLTVKKAPSGAEAVKDDKGNILYYRTQEVDFVMQNKIIETRYYIDGNEGKELSAEIMKRYRVNSVAYTAGFKSAVIYLNHKGTIPLHRLSEIMNDLSNEKINVKTSTIIKWEKEFLKQGQENQEKILSEIKEGKVVHVDETSIKINTNLHWIHTISNERGILYTITKKRSDRETGPLNKLASFDSILVHDHLKSYYTLENCRHAECNAHAQRYLQEGIDFEGSEACGKVLEILQMSLHKKHELQRKGYREMMEEEISDIRETMQNIMFEEISRYGKEHPDIKKKYEASYIKLFRRMMEYIDEHLLFLTDFDVPYTNNEAERCCRKIKTKKNASHQFISEESAQSYASVMSVIETARRKGNNPLREIEKIIAS